MLHWSAEDQESEATLRDLALGAAASGSLLDTAERYGTEFGPPFDRWPFGKPGRCEELLGQALQGRCGILATKFTPVPWRMSAGDVVAACRASARRLGVEAVDLYQIHHPDIVQPLRKFGIANKRDDELWQGLADCVEMGIARNVGVCNYGPTLLGRAQDALLRRGVRLASNQINLSLLYRRQGVMPTLQARGKTCSQVALNWVISQGAVPIPGARTPERFGEYLGALGWRLTEDEAGQLEEAAEALPFDFEGAGFRYSSGKFVGYGIERWYLN